MESSQATLQLLNFSGYFNGQDTADLVVQNPKLVDRHRGEMFVSHVRLRLSLALVYVGAGSKKGPALDGIRGVPSHRCRAAQVREYPTLSKVAASCLFKTAHPARPISTRGRFLVDDDVLTD